MTPGTAARRSSLDGLREWAARDPDRVAITDGRSSITFGALLPRVEATAAAGRAALADAPAGAFVPVLVDRSVGSATAALACLVGRVPFFPVDVAASPALARRLMERAGDPGCYLSGAAGAHGIPGARALEVVDVAAGPEPTAAEAEDPALIVFSSGSTGEPKGIVLPRRALEQRWRSRDELAEQQLGDARREPIITPFDSAWGLNLLADVASGFSVYVADVARLGLPAFLREMAAFGPTALALPAQLGRLLGQLPAGSAVPLPTVRRVNIGSEAVRYEHVCGLRAILRPDTLIVHNLASSEAGRAIVHDFLLADTPAEGVLPLGHVVFPDDVRLVPVDGRADDVAEVHVAGAIASGYLDDPELTAARFYDDADGRRWWRSGDLVSLDADGLYRHEGRMDDVVKVGGKLAAPADVTAVLLTVDGVTAAITVPVVTDGNTRLIAHVEVAPDSHVTLAEVHGVLAERLPPHAVPAAIMRHAVLPITVRGKVDRRALADGPFLPW